MASPLDAAQRGCLECTLLQALSHSKNEKLQNPIQRKHAWIWVKDSIVYSYAVSWTQMMFFCVARGAIWGGEVMLGRVFIFILFLKPVAFDGLSSPGCLTAVNELVSCPNTPC